MKPQIITILLLFLFSASACKKEETTTKTGTLSISFVDGATHNWKYTSAELVNEGEFWSEAFEPVPGDPSQSTYGISISGDIDGTSSTSFVLSPKSPIQLVAGKFYTISSPYWNHPPCSSGVQSKCITSVKFYFDEFDLKGRIKGTFIGYNSNNVVVANGSFDYSL